MSHLNVSYLNMLFLLNDVCKLFQNIYKKLIPVPMTTSYFTYLNDLRKKGKREVVEHNLKTNWSFQSSYVIQDYRNSSDLLYQNVLKAIPENEEDERVLYQFWKESFLHQVSKKDFENLKVNFVIPNNVTWYEFREDAIEADLPTDSILKRGYKRAQCLTKTSTELKDEDLIPRKINILWNKGYSVLSSVGYMEDLLGDLSSKEFSVIGNNLEETKITYEHVYDQCIYLMYYTLQTKANFLRSVDFSSTPKHVVTLPSLSLQTRPTFKKLTQFRGPEYIQNTCFMNTVLVALLLFPSTYVLDILYDTPIEENHFLDLTKKKCAAIKIDITDVNLVAAYSYLDCKNRIQFVLALRNYFEALQIGDQTRLEEARGKVYSKVLACNTYTAERITQGSFGENEAILEYFNELFNLRSYNSVKTVNNYYRDRDAVVEETEADCVSTNNNPVSLLYQASLNWDTVNILTLQNLLSLKIENTVENIDVQRDWFECDSQKLYLKRVSFFYFDFKLVGISLSRKDWKPEPRDFFEVKVQPDQVLKMSLLSESGQILNYDLYLRGIILHLKENLHYVSLVCNPSNKKWYLYNSNLLELYANTYEDMLIKTYKTYSYVNAKQVDKYLPDFALKHSTMFIYSRDTDVKTVKSEIEESKR
jgi:hypothetical protein